VVDDDDSDSLPDLSDAEENPYADIRLEGMNTGSRDKDKANSIDYRTAHAPHIRRQAR